MNQAFERDLLVLAADKNMEAAMRGVLLRHHSFGARQITFDIRRHPQKDSGCCLSGVDFLQPFGNQYRYALIVFDHEGSSRENEKPKDIEQDLEAHLSRRGWGKRSAVIVLFPELEAWVWSDSPHVENALGWQGRQPKLRSWLQDAGFLGPGDIKPKHPKEAMEKALWEVRKPRSSAIYQNLAQNVSLSNCEDRAFCKLKSILSEWFGV